VDRNALRDADEITRNLAAGKPVSVDALARARDAYLDQLWKSSPGTHEAAQRGLLQIYENTRDEQERSTLIGDLVAAGVPAQATLEKILPADPKLAWLLSILPLPLSEKLTRIVSFLASEAGERSQESDPGSDDPVAPHSDPRWVQYGRTEESQDDKTSGRADAGPKVDDGPPELESIVRDPVLDQATRLDAAMTMGASAVPILASLLAHADPGEREFAMVAMTHLGKTDAAWRSVRMTLQSLELQPRHRGSAELVRQGIEAARHPDGAEAGPRRRQKDAASAPDGWLRRALRDCDAPSILQASAGREAFAITLVMRRYAEIRKH
jgi:hypothetical protein